MSTIKRDQPVAVLEHQDNRPDWALSDDRVPVFAVRRKRYPEGADVPEGGDPYAMDEVVYSMPAKPNPGVALRFLKMARTMGDVASSWLIETAIGEEGYDALCDELETYQGDPSKLLQQVSEKIQTVLMGGLGSGPKA